MSITTPTRVSLVTGGSRGIGRAAAERLAADGHAVAILYLSNQTEAEAAVASIEEAGGGVLVQGRNQANADGFRSLAEETNLDLHVLELDVTSQNSEPRLKELAHVR